MRVSSIGEGGGTPNFFSRCDGVSVKWCLDLVTQDDVMKVLFYFFKHVIDCF